MSRPFYAFHAPTATLLEPGPDGYRVRVRVPLGTAVERAWLRSEPDNETLLTPLEAIAEDARWVTWAATLHPNPAEDLTIYAFKFVAGHAQWWLSEAGITPYLPRRDQHFRLLPGYRPARWVWSQVFYQIFPERFHDGDPGNNVRSGEYLYHGRPVVAKAWTERPDRKQGPLEFFGGDLEGIRLKLAYLADLGVTGLYLNPIFASPSNHKYDTSDYYRIDPHFGSNDDFARLCGELRARGMRIILDAVVNHTSLEHPWFDRHSEHDPPGAYRSPGSPTRDFYHFADEDPDSYAHWKGARSLPVLDFASPGVRERIYQADDAVLRYWLRPPYRIDGWRFDVIHMLGEGAGAHNNHHYVRAFRRTLREENPDAYVLGEHFGEATRWLQGDQEDAAMNYYGFSTPLLAFLTGRERDGTPVRIDAADFDGLLRRAREPLPFAIQLSQFNLLGSHDTPRVATLTRDPARNRLAVTMLLTYLGVPSVYYGDEVGLEGGHDPDNRRPFPWNEASWDQGLRGHYRLLIALRRRHRALQEGALVTLHAEGDIYAFARLLEREVVVVILNRGPRTGLTLPTWKLGLADEALRSVFSGQPFQNHAGELELDLPATGSEVLVGSVEVDQSQRVS